MWEPDGKPPFAPAWCRYVIHALVIGSRHVGLPGPSHLLMRPALLLRVK